MKSDLFVALDYKGEKRLGIIKHQEERVSAIDEGGFFEEFDIDLLDDKYGGFARISIPFSDRQTLKSIRVSDDAYQTIRQRYSFGEDMPMTGNSKRDPFSKSF